MHVAASSSVGDDAQGGFVVLLMFIRLKVRPLARARKETSPSRRAHTATTDARGTVTSLSSGPGPEPGEVPRFGQVMSSNSRRLVAYESGCST